MKKIEIYVMMLAMMMAVTFVGCGGDDKNPPSVKITDIGGGDKIVLDAEAQTINFKVEVTSEDPLSIVKVTIEGLTVAEGTVSETITEMTTGFDPENGFSKEYSMADLELILSKFLAEATMPTAITLYAATTEEESATTTMKIDVINIPTSLEGPVDFTWERFGSNKGIGLAEFGLEWLSDTETNIVITPAAGTKLVILTVNDWTSIETKEALAEIIEQTSGVTEWKEIPAKKEFNHVIATKTAEGKYFLLNPTKHEIDPNDGDHRIITGKYKY